MYSKRSPSAFAAGIEFPYISIPGRWGIAPSTGFNLLRRYSSRPEETTPPFSFASMQSSSLTGKYMGYPMDGATCELIPFRSKRLVRRHHLQREHRLPAVRADRLRVL